MPANPTEVGTPFGLRDGQLLHVDDVLRGKACNCVCPSCQAPLVAKQGKVVVHHFAHASGSDCAGAFESAIHLAAKQLLETAKEIALPAVDIKFETDRDPIRLSESATYTLDSVAAEQRVGNIVADLLVEVSGRELIIEIKVTHAVDEQKLDRIESLGISAIEIDLSDLPRDATFDALEKPLIASIDRKAWLYNRPADERLKELISKASKRAVVMRGLALHIDECPLPARVWNGKPYANVIDDCLACPYAMDVGGNMSSIACAAFDEKLREQIDSSPTAPRNSKWQPLD